MSVRLSLCGTSAHVVRLPRVQRHSQYESVRRWGPSAGRRGKHSLRETELRVSEARDRICTRAASCFRAGCGSDPRRFRFSKTSEALLARSTCRCLRNDVAAQHREGAKSSRWAVKQSLRRRERPPSVSETERTSAESLRGGGANSTALLQQLNSMSAAFCCAHTRSKQDECLVVDPFGANVDRRSGCRRREIQRQLTG